jgi:hypothetical protein
LNDLLQGPTNRVSLLLSSRRLKGYVDQSNVRICMITAEQVEWTVSRRGSSTTDAVLVVEQTRPSQNRYPGCKGLVRVTGRSLRGANSEPTLQLRDRRTRLRRRLEEWRIVQEALRQCFKNDGAGRGDGSLSTLPSNRGCCRRGCRFRVECVEVSRRGGVESEGE